MLSRFSVLFVTKIFRLLRVCYALRKGKKETTPRNAKIKRAPELTELPTEIFSRVKDLTVETFSEGIVSTKEY